MPKPIKNCIELLITATKWLPVLVTLLIYTWGYYAYTFQLVLFTMENLVQQILCIVILNILFILSFWSYIQTIIAPQGKIPSKFYLTREISEDLAKAPTEQARDEILAYVVKTNDLPVSCRTYSGGVRFCEKCNLIKPDRCHHCSICGICILRMDHHCPWINNCVSFTNYKFFVLFLGYTLALCIFVGSTTLPYTLNFWNYPENVYKPGNSTSSTEAPQNISNDAITVPFRFHILFLCFVSSMLSFGVMFLYCYHIHLLLRNQSTLESFRAPLMAHGPDRNAFNLGKRNNALQLFGRSKLLWFIPVFTTEGSGISYEQRPHLGQGDEEARQELLNHRPSNNTSRQNVSNTDTEL